MADEILDIVNEHGEIISRAPRHLIHGNNSLLHRVVHLIVLNSSGDILLQKRSMDKDVAPGRWDTSVGGHVDAGESIDAALKREMMEELGFVSNGISFAYKYIHKNSYESELVFTHECIFDGPFSFNAEEIDEVRFWPVAHIRKNLGSAIFSDNFEDEFRMYTEFKGRMETGL